MYRVTHLGLFGATEGNEPVLQTIGVVGLGHRNYTADSQCCQPECVKLHGVLHVGLSMPEAWKLFRWIGHSSCVSARRPSIDVTSNSCRCPAAGLLRSGPRRWRPPPASKHSDPKSCCLQFHRDVRPLEQAPTKSSGIRAPKCGCVPVPPWRRNRIECRRVAVSNSSPCENPVRMTKTTIGNARSRPPLYVVALQRKFRECDESTQERVTLVCV